MKLFDRAQRFVGVRELDGTRNHPLIQWWLYLCGYDLESPDEIPWCSAFVNGVAWDCRTERSKSAAARSWLKVGSPVPLDEARLDDVVILKRGGGNQPGPEVLKAQGHVGFFAGWRQGGGVPIPEAEVLVLGGNQGDAVTIEAFRRERVLGVRRLV